MSKYTIAIPHLLYEKAQRLAQQTSQSVDEIICTRLEGALDQPILDLPSDERAELQAMSYLSTDALWTIAREQMPPDLQHAMSQLHGEKLTGHDHGRGVPRLVCTSGTRAAADTAQGPGHEVVVGSRLCGQPRRDASTPGPACALFPRVISTYRLVGVPRAGRTVSLSGFECPEEQHCHSG